MCGIVGFVGAEQAAPILLDGLTRLEYRGYDSAGLAVYDPERGLQLTKAKGRLKALADLTNGGNSVPGTVGIGHTRWATHGEPSYANSHPHADANTYPNPNTHANPHTHADADADPDAGTGSVVRED